MRFLFRVFVISVAVNYVWEMAQMPLYERMPFDSVRSWLVCFRAALGDGVIVLTIWAAGAAVFRRVHWFTPLTPLTALVALAAGATIAVGIELHALSAERWAYSSLMPILPGINVGVSPLIQLLVLPWPAMRLADYLSQRRRSSPA